MKTTKILLLTILFSIFACSVFKIEKPETNHIIIIDDDNNLLNKKILSCLRMYENLEKYSNEYNIPRHIFYNIAFLETRYHGPFDWGYKHNLGSYAGALGPMQIMPSTAKLIHKESISKTKLKNDIEFNVRTSAMVLRVLHDKYNDWGKVCGAYNTGRPILNKYSKYCTSNKKYWNNWYYWEEFTSTF